MAVAVGRKDDAAVRAGDLALSLLALPLNDVILGALAQGPMSLVELRQQAGSPSQSTMRNRLQTLVQLGVAGGRRQDGFAGTLDYELTDSGRGLLEVAQVLQAWLSVAPGGPLLLGSSPARSAIKSLIAGWDTSMLRALAARPLSLTELDSVIASLSYPALERRLTTMRLAGHVEAQRTAASGTPYAVTDWLRRAAAPLAVAARWERRHLTAGARPITKLDIEAGFLLAVPLLEPPAELSGECRLAVALSGADGAQLTGVTVGIDGGRISSCVSKMEANAETSVTGAVDDWLRAVIDAEATSLSIRGDHQIARALLDGLSGSLFRHPVRAESVG